VDTLVLASQPRVIALAVEHVIIGVEILGDRRQIVVVAREIEPARKSVYHMPTSCGEGNTARCTDDAELG